MTAPLDAVLPDPSHRTRYEVRVAAPPDATWAAMRAVTPAELPLTRVLTALRAAPARVTGGGHDSAVRAPDRPLVDQFIEAGFGVVCDDAPRLMIVAAALQPWRLRGGTRTPLTSAAQLRAFARPDHVVAVMSFELAPDGVGATRLATETRVEPTDAASARSFARYWTLIRLGSDIIRLDLLYGIRRRAQRTAARGGAD